MGKTGIAVPRQRRLAQLLIVVAILSVFAFTTTAGAATSSATGTSTCVVHSNPSMVEMGFGPSSESSIADVIQVECSPSLSQNTVTITSDQLSNACHGTLSWSSPYPYLPVTGNSFTVTLDNDGNATAVVWGGPSCAASTDLIEASLNASPYTTATTTFRILPPANTKPGVTANPRSQVEDSVWSSAATVIQVEFPSVFAEKTVDISSNQLWQRCGVAPNILWVGPEETVLGSNVPSTSVTLDDNGNAFVVALLGASCASGTSTIVADLTVAPYTTYTGNFNILSPRPTVPTPTPGH